MARRRKVPIEQRIATRVRELRVAQGLSQGDLARLAGTSRSLISTLEGFQKTPSITTVESLAAALGVPIEDLVSSEGPRRKPDAADRFAEELRARGPEYLSAAKALLKSIDKAAKTAAKSHKTKR